MLKSSRLRPNRLACVYSETLPSRPEFFEPKESREANVTCGASASLTPGCSTPGSGYASPLTPPQFCTERQAARLLRSSRDFLGMCVPSGIVLNTKFGLKFRIERLRP